MQDLYKLNLFGGSICKRLQFLKQKISFLYFLSENNHQFCSRVFVVFLLLLLALLLLLVAGGHEVVQPIELLLTEH